MPEALYITPSEQNVDYTDNNGAEHFEDVGRWSGLIQTYGRRMGAVVLAGSTALGLSACESGSNQTIRLGSASTEKVISKNGDILQTGLCAETTQTIHVGTEKKEQKGHDCSPSTDQLKNQTIRQVQSASENGNTIRYTVSSNERSCDAPGKKFVAAVAVGDVISKQKENYREFGEDNKTVINRVYCRWDKE